MTIAHRWATSASSEGVDAAENSDTVTLGPPGQQPSVWVELEEAGILGAAATISTPLGGLITDSMRAGLERVFKRLSDGGYEFHFRKFDETDSWQSTMDDLLKNAPAEPGDRAASHPDMKQRLVINSLDDLRFVDAVTGGEATLTEAELERKQFIEKVQAAGQNLNHDDDEPNAITHPAVLLQRLGKPDSRVYYHPAEDRPVGFKSEEGWKSVDFFYYDGSADALKHPELAQQLKAIPSRGWTIRDGSSKSTPFRHYLYEGTGEDLSLDRGRRFKMKVPSGDLDRIDPYLADLDELEEYFPKTMDPVLNRHGESGLAAQAAREVLAAGDKFPVKVRLAVYSELHGAVMSGRGHNSNQFARMKNLLKDMVERADSVSELALMTQAVTPMLEARGVPAIREAQRALEEMDLLSGFPRDDEEQARYFKLVAACGSFTAAKETESLIAISHPQEPEAGLALATELGSWLDEKTKGGLPDHYRTLLARRLPEETVESAGERYSRLLRLLAARDNQSQAPALFAQVQKEAGGDLAKTEELTSELLDQLTNDISPSEALKRVLDPAAAPDIEIEEDLIMIGGILLERD